MTAGGHWAEVDPFLLFEQMAAAAEKPIDPNHAFYLGYEMAKAVTALTLGKDYRQDEALDWGFLTRVRELASAGTRAQKPRRRQPVTKRAQRYRLWAGGRIEMSELRTRTDRDSTWRPVVVPLGSGLAPEEALVRLAGRPHVPVSRQCAARSGAGTLFVSRSRSVRFFDGSGRWHRRLGSAGRTIGKVRKPAPCPACRRFKGERPVCGPTI